jgi:hypothetical protein
VAQKDWGWKAAFDLDAMVNDMLTHLRPRIAKDAERLAA